MKTQTHGLTEKETELVKLLVRECESTRDIHVIAELFWQEIAGVICPTAGIKCRIAGEAWPGNKPD